MRSSASRRVLKRCWKTIKNADHVYVLDEGQWHQKARRAAADYASARLVTTEAMLVEVLNFFAQEGFNTLL